MADARGRLEAFFADRLPSAESVSITRIGRMHAGASNETLSLDLEVSCDGHHFELPLVLRPERQDGVLAPYDVLRQFRVMAALASTDVPVPTVAWYEPDRAIIGAPFFCMTRIVGETLPLFWYGDSPRLRAAARALASVHAVDWRGTGLGFLLPGEVEADSPTEAELGRWRQRAEHLRIARAPLLVALGSFLTANEPADSRLALLHGDPNAGNYLFRGSEVAAVLDWELAAIGDPRSDFGFYSALMTVFGGIPGEGGTSLLSRAYEAETGVPLHDLEYYEALGLYRMAVVMAGWTGHLGSRGHHYGMDAIARRLSNLLGPRWAT